jgi:hypothetical protein
MLNYRIEYSLEPPVINAVDCPHCEDGYVHLEDSTQLACGVCDSTGTLAETQWLNIQVVQHQFESMPTFDDIKAITDAIECYAIVFQGFEE